MTPTPAALRLAEPAIAEIVAPVLSQAAAPVSVAAIAITQLPSTSTSRGPDPLVLLVLLLLPGTLFLIAFRRFTLIVRI